MTTLVFFVENHPLALAMLELVRRHDYVRINELYSYIHALTSELAIVRNERDRYRAEMVRLNLIAPNFGMTRYGRANLHHSIIFNRIEEAVVGAQQGEDFSPMITAIFLGWKTVSQPPTNLLWHWISSQAIHI
jgi:hypothetical protein